MKQGALIFDRPQEGVAPVAAPAPRPETPRVVFAVGDRVRPKREWPTDEKGRPIPSGIIISIEPWGNGQLLIVEGESRGFPSGMFDRVDA